MTVAGGTEALIETVVIPSTPTEAAGTGFIIIDGTEAGADGVVSLARFFSFSTVTSFSSSSIFRFLAIFEKLISGALKVSVGAQTGP